MKNVGESKAPHLASIPGYSSTDEKSVTSDNFKVVFLKALQLRTGADFSSEIQSAEDRRAQQRKAEEEYQDRLVRMQPIRQAFIKSLEMRPGLKVSMSQIAPDSLQSPKAAIVHSKPAEAFNHGFQHDKLDASVPSKASDAKQSSSRVEVSERAAKAHKSKPNKLIATATKVANSGATTTPTAMRATFQKILKSCDVIAYSTDKADIKGQANALLAKENRRYLTLLHRDDDNMLGALEKLKSTSTNDRREAAEYIRWFLTDQQNSAYSKNRSYIYQ